MPDELELLEQKLAVYQAELENRVEKEELTSAEYIAKLGTLCFVFGTIEDIRKAIKNFEDTVSGSGG